MGPQPPRDEDWLHSPSEEDVDEGDVGARRGPRWTYLHLWQIQPVRDVLIVVILFGLVILGERIRIVTVPLLLALLFAYLFEPLISRLCRLRWMNRRAASALVIATSFLTVFVPAVLGGSFAIVQGARLAATIRERAIQVNESVEAPDDEALAERLGDGSWREIRDWIVDVNAQAEMLRQAQEEAAERAETPETSAHADPESAAEEDLTSSFLGVDARDVASAIKSLTNFFNANYKKLWSQALDTGRGLARIAFGTVSSVGYFLFGTFLTAFFFFFISSGWHKVIEFGRGLLPVKNRDRVVFIVRKMDVAISGFIRGRLTIALVLAGFYSVGFWLIGVPAPLLTGPGIAFLAIIPYTAVLGIPVVILLLWLEAHTGFQGTWWWVLFAPIACYQLGQAADDYLLTPLIQGKSTDLDTPTILFASIAGGALMGFYGLLVAIPLAACLRILIREVFWPRFRDWSEGRERDFLPIKSED